MLFQFRLTNGIIIYQYILNKLIGFTYTTSSGTKEYLYIRNIQGDITSIIDTEGNIICTYAYDGYGNHIVLDENGKEDTLLTSIGHLNPFRYRGYYFDEENGLYYLNSRYYDPETGRFISPDVLSILDETKGQINGLNLYMYCRDNPIKYCDHSGNFAILAILCAITLVGLGLTIGGVASNNNIMTAIGLTMIAIPALVSSGLAVAAGFSGATLTGIIGGVTVAAGLGTATFASAEYQEAITGNNWMIDAGMSEEMYNALMLVTATIATLGTFASSVGYSFQIKSISQFGKFGEYNGMKFVNADGKTRVLSFHTHGHKIAHGFKSIPEWHWQLTKWDSNGMKTAGTIARWIWWSLTRI